MTEVLASTRSFNGKYFSVIEGVKKVEGGVQVTVVNVYYQRSLKDKKVLWNEICEVRESQPNRVWCVVGDFNAVRKKGERIKREDLVFG